MKAIHLLCLWQNLDSKNIFLEHFIASEINTPQKTELVWEIFLLTKQTSEILHFFLIAFLKQGTVSSLYT